MKWQTFSQTSSKDDSPDDGDIRYNKHTDAIEIYVTEDLHASWEHLIYRHDVEELFEEMQVALIQSSRNRFASIIEEHEDIDPVSQLTEEEILAKKTLLVIEQCVKEILQKYRDSGDIE